MNAYYILAIVQGHIAFLKYAVKWRTYMHKSKVSKIEKKKRKGKKCVAG